MFLSKWMPRICCGERKLAETGFWEWPGFGDSLQGNHQLDDLWGSFVIPIPSFPHTHTHTHTSCSATRPTQSIWAPGETGSGTWEEATWTWVTHSREAALFSGGYSALGVVWRETQRQLCLRFEGKPKGTPKKPMRSPVKKKKAHPQNNQQIQVGVPSLEPPPPKISDFSCDVCFCRWLSVGPFLRFGPCFPLLDLTCWGFKKKRSKPLRRRHDKFCSSDMIWSSVLFSAWTGKRIHPPPDGPFKGPLPLPSGRKTKPFWGLTFCFSGTATEQNRNWPLHNWAVPFVFHLSCLISLPLIGGLDWWFGWLRTLSHWPPARTRGSTPQTNPNHQSGDIWLYSDRFVTMNIENA